MTLNTYRVEITGWMQDESFEDHAQVDAHDEDEAFEAARRTIEARYGHPLEIGDCRVLLRWQRS